MCILSRRRVSPVVLTILDLRKDSHGLTSGGQCPLYTTLYHTRRQQCHARATTLSQLNLSGVRLL